MSNSITHQNQFENQQMDTAAYGSSLRNNNNSNAYYHESLGTFPGIERISTTVVDLVQGPVLTQGSDHTRHLMDLLGAANESNHHHQQGLSLSLGSHMQLVPSDEYNRPRSLNQATLMMNPNYFLPQQESRSEQRNNPPQVEHLTSDYFFTAGTGSCFASAYNSLNRSPSTSYGGAESFAAVVANSRYLKPVQSLLQDLVHVGGNDVDRMNEKYVEKLFHGSRTLSSELKAELKNNGHLLTDHKRQHQNKIAKLIALLDQVESRYEKYYHQMEEVVSSFEMIAGLGAANCYTALALQAMSRHFSSLRDAIVSQINVEKRKLFHDLPKISSGLCQLSLFDRDSNNNRQNRMSSLQQIGAIHGQRQVWRPIRGLPETSVAILRSWLFEHFLHPYPNDSEKLMLASQTGLTKNQVSNWFINARVRLWKPMIEEMYKAEFGGDSSEDSNPPPNNYLTRKDTADCVEV